VNPEPTGRAIQQMSLDIKAASVVSRSVWLAPLFGMTSSRLYEEDV